MATIGKINVDVELGARSLSPLQQASSDIEKSVMALGETVELLARRLEPVLRAADASPEKRADGVPEPSYSSQHATELRRHELHVNRVRDAVEDILARLDV